jgi:ACS family tartrate transporter-like MFS transporter
MATTPLNPASPLDRARRKAYWRLLPLLFACYVIAYVDRTNVSIAKLTMSEEMPAFDDGVVGLGAGIFFLGYFLLEIPGTLLVEKWSASKWISRIMISWGIVAAATAFIRVPMPGVVPAAESVYRTFGWKFDAAVFQFYAARFLLGLAEAGFFPGVIVYLTHWFPVRDRANALSWFLIATPIAQMISPLLSGPIIQIGANETINGVAVAHPQILGLSGWQWLYIAWGVPAVILGVLVLIFLTDRPHQARWLDEDEREALVAELEAEKLAHKGRNRHMSWGQALRHPKVLVLAAAYFFVVTGNYGVEIFLPSVLKKWYGMNYLVLTLLLVVPPLGALIGQRFVGWNSDRTGERRWHAALPIYFGAAALLLAVLPSNPPPLAVSVALFTVAALGAKAYLPAFWTLPSLFLTEAAAAGSVGLINSVGNLGGFVGPSVLGHLEKQLGTYRPGLFLLCGSMFVSASIIVALGLGRREVAAKPSDAGPTDPGDSLAERLAGDAPFKPAPPPDSLEVG